MTYPDPATAGLYGVHVLHTDRDGDVVAAELYDDGTGEHLFGHIGHGRAIATTDEMRSIAAKITALCDRLDQAERAARVEELPSDSDALVGRVLHHGTCDPAGWTITSVDVVDGMCRITTNGDWCITRAAWLPVEVVR